MSLLLLSLLPACTTAQADPARLASGAPELLGEHALLAERLRTAQAVGEAVLSLQTAWTRLTPGKSACASTPRLELAWRIEHFGAAWREATQATLAQADRLKSIQSQPTVSPLLTPNRMTELNELYRDVTHQKAIFLEASAWQNQYIRPILTSCPVYELAPVSGVDIGKNIARGEDVSPVALIALGDGYVCPNGQRAEGAVVLVGSGRACWSSTPTCNCEIAPVLPGAVLGPTLFSSSNTP